MSAPPALSFAVSTSRSLFVALWESLVWSGVPVRLRRKILFSSKKNPCLVTKISTPGQDTREDGHATADTPGTGHSGHTDSGHAHLRKPAQTETHTTDPRPLIHTSNITAVLELTISTQDRKVDSSHPCSHSDRGAEKGR